MGNNIYRIDFIDDKNNKRFINVTASSKADAKIRVKRMYNVIKIIKVIDVGKIGENPMPKMTKIYDKILAIEDVKGKDSLWPKEKFRHNFKHKSEAEVYGLEDGSLLIKSKNGK